MPSPNLWILDRDKWVCQLCGVKTPKRLRGTVHPRAPEIGHIIPRSRRGRLNDPKNLRCECRRCNAHKYAFKDEELPLVFPTNGKKPDLAIIRRAQRKQRNGQRKGGKASQATLKRNKLGFYNPKVRKRASKNGGYASQKVLKREKKGFYDPKVLKKGGYASQKVLKREKKGFYDPNTGRKGGLIGGRKGGRAAQKTLKRKKKGIYDPKVRTKAGSIWAHNRWHRDRGIKNLDCKICQEGYE